MREGDGGFDVASALLEPGPSTRGNSKRYQATAVAAPFRMGTRSKEQRQPWVNRHTWLVVASGTGFAAVFLSIALVRPQTQLHGAVSAEALGAAREFWLKLAAGAGAVAGALIAWGKFEISKVQVGSDRFGKAVEMIGSDKPDVVLGGLYSLQALGRTTQDYQSTITEVLSAYVRTHAAKSALQDSRPTDGRKPHWASPDVTVQAALTVLGGRRDWHGHADLTGAVLPGASLGGLQFPGAKFRGVRLKGADLVGVDFSAADLMRAEMNPAFLNGACLRGADLRAADLTGSQLVGADLRDADLRGANLMRVSLAGADLRGAQLDRATLDGATTHPTTKWPDGYDPVGAGVELRHAEIAPSW